MSTIEQIETAILTLAPDEFQQLRQWFADVDYQRWDRQIEQDVEFLGFGSVLTQNMTN